MAHKYLARSRISPVSRQLVRRLVTVMGAWFDSMNLGQSDAVRKLKRDRYTQARDALERRILRLEEAGNKAPLQLWYVSIVWQLEQMQAFMAGNGQAAMPCWKRKDIPTAARAE